jgi:hypothetical protein
MPRTSTGKWVARAGATGGGRTYRGQVPINWYAALVLILILGLGSLVYSRYQYQHPAGTSKVQPTTSATWYSGFAFDVCGKQLTPVPSNQKSTGSSQSFSTAGDGVIVVSPKNAAAAGDNAVLGKFVDGYPHMALSSTAVSVPKGKSAKTATSTTYTNGQSCAAGTPDAGKKGYVQVAYWTNAFNTKGKAHVVSGNPATLKFTDNQLITIGFVPQGTKLPKPNGKVVTALVQKSAALGSSTTTTAPSTSTTAPSTSTTAPSTSTTAPSTSTTAPSTTTTPTTGK